MSYYDDMCEIRDACQSDAKHLRDALYFVTASIRTQFSAVAGQLHDIHQRGADSKHLWGFKGESWEYITANYDQLHTDALTAINRGTDVDLMRVFLRVPGLGLAKAGFACQLFSGRVGCIDTHNIKLYGVSESVLRMPKSLTELTQLRKIEAYIDLCARCGGSQNLWGAWCDLIAHRQAKHFEDGARVSRHHVELCVREV